MTTLDPKATADAIRAAWNRNPPAPEPDQLHELSFLEEVCKHLGVEPTPFNLSHVARLMAKHDIDQHKADEYPKALNTKDDRGRAVPVLYPDDDPEGRAGLPVIFNNADEERNYGSGLPASPKDDPYPGNVQNTYTDGAPPDDVAVSQERTPEDAPLPALSPVAAKDAPPRGPRPAPAK